MALSNDMAPAPVLAGEAAEQPRTPRVPPPPAYIVGIGASAGGLDAFTTFITDMRPDSGMAFVLVQHLDPQQPSLLPELLAPHTFMPVRSVVDRMPIAPNHVYLIPPNTTLTIDQGMLCLATPLEAHGHRMPIDHFFHSLAANQGARAIGIIFSGTGSDGTLGLRAIKDCGGMTIVQAPETARYDAMPRSAIARRVVDHILPIAEMPAVLLAHVQYGIHHAPLTESGDLQVQGREELRAICLVLRQATGHDFQHYKPATLLRRIARRMQVLHIETIAAYAEQLRQNRQEADHLFQDLLISVTQFFRDLAVFGALAGAVIPNLFGRQGFDTPVRVWVAGCASGEEAYSIAILLREHMSRLEAPPTVQVFATDIDEAALEVARQGQYDAGIAEHVSAERLARFFIQDGSVYQVTKAIRDMCIFSAHNLISDPPFARIDLIACRNLLIYFDADLQRKLIPLLHYALAPQGYLLLGSSESVAAHTELFRTIDKQHRIFQRKEVLIRPQIDFPLTEPLRRPIRQLGPARQPAATAAPDIGTTLERILLRHYAPPSAIVDQEGAAVYFSSRTGAYLEAPAGAPNLDILAMVHPQLRLTLQTAIHAALKSRAPTTHENLAITTGDVVQRLNLIVRPLSELGPDSGLLLVVFQELGPPTSVHAQPSALGPRLDEPITQQLAQELQTTRDALETTIEQLREANTEQSSANEDLLSINEELQSANEELQTSKEEIQSINEELQTVNTELNRKVEQLDRVNADLANLLASMQIPALFLYADGRIARFTPAATDVFRLIESDVGRPITDIAARYRDGDLIEAVALVLHTLAPYDEPVYGPESNTWWIMRIRPYRTLTNQVDGVVVTFSDITDLKRAEAEREQLLAAVQRARAYAERIVETVREPLLILDAELRVQSANRAFYTTFQVTPAATEQALLYELGNRQWDTPELRALLAQQLDRNTAVESVEVTGSFPELGMRTMLLTARLIEQTPDRVPLILLAIEDITERRDAAAALQKAYDALEARVQERTSDLAQANTVLQAQIGERERAEHARQLLLRQLVTVQEEERRRISRELHDQMGQDLTVLMLGLKALRDAAPDDSSLHERVEPLQMLATRIGREVRTLALQLRPAALDELGLIATLANDVEQWSARTLIAIDFHSSGLEAQRLPSAIETALYRLAQEALTNILKHAQATNVSLIVERRVDAVHMIVEDNGIGFDVVAVRSRAHIEQRLGLVGMDERVAQLGGVLTIESTPGSGTTVFIRIPLTDDVEGDTDAETPDLSRR
jgi:two-component system, chemotaxis family, CheB/CheR fusion protein